MQFFLYYIVQTKSVQFKMKSLGTLHRNILALSIGFADNIFTCR